MWGLPGAWPTSTQVAAAGRLAKCARCFVHLTEDLLHGMSKSETRRLGKLLVTGFPGWLVQGYLDRLPVLADCGLTSLRCFALRGTNVDTQAVAARLGVPVEVVYGDLRDPESIAAAVRDIDTVFHAAGILHVGRTRDWYEINTEGTRLLVQGAADCGVERFLYISSNAAAGRASSAQSPMLESDMPRPLSHYGRSHWLPAAPR